MILFDALTLDASKVTSDGYLAVRANAARTGVYQYPGSKIDPKNAHGLHDQEIVNVLRDEATVFDMQAVQSFIGKPITNDHPTVSVNSNNWRDHSRGVIMGAKWEEGGYLAFDLLLQDAEAIKAVKSGKRQLSNGYLAGLEFGDFTAADGTKCQARQTSIKGNHVAIVDKGRAGDNCAIKDSIAICDANPAALVGLSLKKDKQVKTITLDGLPVKLDDVDAVEAAFKKLQDAATKATADAATLKTDNEAKDAQIAVLKQELADANAKVTPAQLRDAAKAYIAVVDKAKAMGVSVEEEEDEGAIKKKAVKAKMGDAAASYTDAQIDAAFAVMSVDAKADPLRKAITDGVTPTLDAKQVEDKAYQDSVTNLNAWRNPAKAAA